MKIKQSINKFVFWLRQDKRRTAMLLFVTLFAVVGTVALIVSRAATPTISVEVESGTLGGAKKIVNDPSASGGGYIQFGQTEPPGALNGERLGISTGYPYLADGVTHASYMAKTAQLGVKWIRLDAIIDGNHPVTFADTALTAAKAHNLKALMVFTYGDTSTPEKRTVLANRVQAYIYHWISAGLIDTVGAYEMWNEPNNTGDPNIPFVSPTAMADFMKKAYPKIKAMTPGKTVVAGGYAPGGGNRECCSGDAWNPADYLDQLYKANGGTSTGMFDAAAIHPYDSSSKSHPNWGWRNTHWLRKVMNNYGDQNKEIWGTEAGWQSCANHGSSPPFTESERVTRFKADMKDWFYGLHNPDGSSNGQFSAQGSDWNTGPFMIFKLYKNALDSNGNSLGLIYTPSQKCDGKESWYEPPIIGNIQLFSATKQSEIQPTW